METINKPFFDYETITGMLGAIWTNLRWFITLLAFIGLIALNIATLASSAVHDFLYKGLSSIPISSMSDLLANSPTERNKRKIAKLEKKRIANKAKVKNISKRIARRTKRIVSVNLSSMFTESLPYIGIATIIGATTYEVKAACDNMKEMDELLKSLDISENNEETDNICGQIKKIKKEEEIKQFILSSKDKYGDFQQNLGSLLNKFKEEANRTWENFRNALGGTIDEMVH